LAQEGRGGDVELGQEAQEGEKGKQKNLVITCTAVN